MRHVRVNIILLHIKIINIIKDKEKKIKLNQIKKENHETMYENNIKYKLLATSAATYSRY